MTSLVFNAAKRVLEQHASEVAAGIGVIAVLLVIFVVVERELLRTGKRAAAEARVRATDPILFSLLVAFTFILGARFGKFI